mgnify:CR=1 FL=1
MQVTARMEDSQYSRIVALVKEAADSKAPMVRLADRYAVPFTALAYVIGAIGWIVSGQDGRLAFTVWPPMSRTVRVCGKQWSAPRAATSRGR